MTYFIRTKTGRLKAPPNLVDRNTQLALGLQGLNLRGQVAAKIGDYVFFNGKGISAGNLGKVIKLTTYPIIGRDTVHTIDIAAEYELLDGTVTSTWLWYLTVIDAAAVQEVKDFYINDGRADRIKVTW